MQEAAAPNRTNELSSLLMPPNQVPNTCCMLLCSVRHEATWIMNQTVCLTFKERVPNYFIFVTKPTCFVALLVVLS